MSTPALAMDSVHLVRGVPEPRWNEFVVQHPQGSVFHLREWAAVYQELPWIEPCYLFAERARAIVGVMPLASVSFGLRGRALVSAPYCVEAGALALDDEVKAQLEAAAERHARELAVDFLEVRQRGQANPSWPASHAYSTFARDLAPTQQENLQAIPRKQRAVIRKAEAEQLIAGTSTDLEQFYRLFAIGARDLGTPVYSRTLFSALLRHLAGRLDIFTVKYAGNCVAAVLSFYFNGRVMPYYAGSLPLARMLKANDFMYWELMCHALERGCTGFDFGRSRQGTGAFAYKKNWGFEPRPLLYQTRAISASGAGELDPDSRFNRIARRAWSHLPLGVANALGPVLARRLY